MCVAPLHTLFVEPAFGEVPKRWSLQYRAASLQSCELLNLAALRKVSGIVEASQRDFCLNTLKDFLQLLSIGRRIRQRGLLTAALVQISEVEEQLLVVGTGTNLTNGKCLRRP